MKAIFGKKNKSEKTDVRQAAHDRLTKDQVLHYRALPTRSLSSPVPFGTGPSGTLTVKLTKDKCAGFNDSIGTIKLCYLVPSGVQASHQPHPGVPYDGTNRVAYLPNNKEGRRLLTRFKLAWNQGCMLTIGHSLTSGKDNQTTFTNIPNKTSLKGGPFGFADPKYFEQANNELDKVGIPNADDCIPYLTRKTGPEESLSVKYHCDLGKFPPTVHDHLAKDEVLQYNSSPTKSWSSPVPLGTGPSGTLTVKLSPDKCAGFQDSSGTIKLFYSVPSGIQASHQANPGVPYDGTSRVAYLPNNEEGRKLLTRFKAAWTFGHMFTIGRSLTSGKDNQTTFTNIPNKTSLMGGPFGFPDLKYFEQANSELDKIGIPSADDCIPYLSREVTQPNLTAKCISGMSDVPRVPHDQLAKEEVLQYRAQPTTSRSSPVPFGTAPSGTLTIKLSEDKCAGFNDSVGTIKLCYLVPSGIQASHQPKPGVPYDGTNRIAYLPNNRQGRKLLTRFKVAWNHGQMFAIGRSLTSGKDDQTTFTKIPNKTSLKPGPFGFPDPKYFEHANNELDKIGIPNADDCIPYLSQMAVGAPWGSGFENDSAVSIPNDNDIIGVAALAAPALYEDIVPIAPPSCNPHFCA